MKRYLAMVIAETLLVGAGTAEAGLGAGSETVAEWRTMLPNSDDGEVFAATSRVRRDGSSVWGWACGQPYTVGELAAYLRYTADPTLTMP